MNKQQVENQALELFNQCSIFGSSYRSVLNSMWETANEKKQYEKCHIISELIADDINEDNDSLELCFD